MFFPNNLPIKDLLETEISKGKFPLIWRKFCKIRISLVTQLDFIRVKGNPVPDFLKKPIAGSTTILFLGMLTLCAIFRLSFRSFFCI